MKYKEVELLLKDFIGKPLQEPLQKLRTDFMKRGMFSVIRWHFRMFT